MVHHNQPGSVPQLINNNVCILPEIRYKVKEFLLKRTKIELPGRNSLKTILVSDYKGFW